MSADLKKRKISSEAYQLMVEGGIFNEEDKIELLDGEIIEMSPVGDPHIGMSIWLIRFLSKNLPENALVSVQNRISLGKYSEPEPDLTICHYKDHYYRNQKATPKDIILLIEVSDTTLAKDREVKLPLYAQAGIQTYWIINLPDRQVEVYTIPQENSYKQISIISGNEILEFPEFGLKIPLMEMFG